ncbi:MAG TPA: hypothetical protein VH796_05255 [Nitrososphaeraceae archaeon]
MYRQIGGSKNRRSDSYWSEGEEEDINNLMTSVDQRTSKQQQEQRIMSSMKLSIQILKSLTSLEALVIFQSVANSGINGIDNTSLAQSILPHITRKQYYQRMAALKQTGLISMTSGKYRLTSLGLVIRSSLGIINKGIMLKWPLRAIDAVEAGAKQQKQNLEPQIKGVLIDKMVTDETIRNILIIDQREAKGSTVICGE